MARNIKKYIAKLGLSQNDVCNALKIKPTTFSDWVNAKTYPRIDKIEMLSNYFGISKSDLVENDSPLPSNMIKLEKINKVPLIGRIACGTPVTAIENVDEYLPMPDNIRADFALICSGDSMIDANIFDGDIAFVRGQPNVENGEIAAVLIDDWETEATLKRVYREGDTLTLVAANAAYPPIIFVKEEINSIRILGKLVAVLHDLEH